ncbi:MAG: RHS repeat-associated core domain-containing protein [Parabacteroides sp.]|nr:RHS repeat-associated core domain-containing protein [Parabacteroides sp.]
MVSTSLTKRLAFEYDSQGRRIAKKVWNNTAGTGTPATYLKYLYDGWNLIAELNGNSATNSLVRSYTWGLDASGSMQGAGGVGGLLMVNAGTNGVHFPAYDLNGNVMGLVNATNGIISAKYEYGPFGEVFCSVGDMAKVNPFQFSTKYTDTETDLVYYGYRYYSPALGRWLSRDPIEERGGLNLYAFVNNDPVNKWDKLGLECTEALRNGKPRMVFTTSPYSDGGWWLTLVSFGESAGMGATQVYSTIFLTYTANVSVLCKCNPCNEFRDGVRIYKQKVENGDWVYYNPASTNFTFFPPLITSIQVGVGNLIGELINKFYNLSFIPKSEIPQIKKAISELPTPIYPTDGEWKGGKSPCEK